MILKVFAIHDAKAGFFQVPFLMTSVGQAIRAVTDLAADPSSMLARHPGDFSLYQIAEWDDASAMFSALVPVLHLGGGEAFVPRLPPVGFDSGER